MYVSAQMNKVLTSVTVRSGTKSARDGGSRNTNPKWVNECQKIKGSEEYDGLNAQNQEQKGPLMTPERGHR